MFAVLPVGATCMSVGREAEPSLPLKELRPYGFGYKLSVAFVLTAGPIMNIGNDEFSEFLDHQEKVEMFQFSEAQLQWQRQSQ